MDPPGQAILFLGIIPALILLYITLKGYDEHYKDKTIFLTFIVGIILGVLAAVVRIYVYILPFVIAYVIVFAFFEQLFKTIVLNLGRFHGKQETPIYGLSLGLGFGSSFTPFLIIAASTVSNDLSFIAIVGFGSLGFILFHAATTAYIGYGIYTYKLTKYLLLAILLQIPFNIIFDATRNYDSQYFLAFNVVLVAYGLIIYYYVIKNILPQIKLQSRKRSKKS